MRAPRSRCRRGSRGPGRARCFRGPGRGGGLARWARRRLGSDADRACGEFVAILPARRALSGSHPVTDPFHEGRFRARSGAGGHADAQEWYRQVRRRLREELGTEPSPLLRRFYNQTLRGVGVEALVAELLGPRRLPRATDGAVSSAPVSVPISTESDTGEPQTLPPLAHQLPPDRRGFVGRAAELARRREAMADNHPPELPGLTLLVGMAGIGKTALALTWAHRSAAAFPDGRLYVDLMGFAERGAPLSADDAVRILLDCLGILDHQLPATAAGRVALYRSVIADKQVLIVLDNVRHADQVRPLLPPSGPAQILATSRNALASLVTIDLARTVTLQPLSALESRELLSVRLGSERTQGREDAVAAIAEHCAHLPLALVVAAGRAWVRPDVPLEDLAAQLGAVGGKLGAVAGCDA